MTVTHWKTLQAFRCHFGFHQTGQVVKTPKGRVLICARPGCDGQHLEAPKSRKPIAKLPLFIAALIAVTLAFVYVVSR